MDKEKMMEYISDAQAKQMILEVGRRMYQGGFVAANDGNISCKVGDNEIWRRYGGFERIYDRGYAGEAGSGRECVGGNAQAFQRDQDAPQSIQREPEGTGRGACASVDGYGFCMRGHQSGRAGADGRGIVLRVRSVSAFRTARDRGSAGSGSSVLP